MNKLPFPPPMPPLFDLIKNSDASDDVKALAAQTAEAWDILVGTLGSMLHLMHHVDEAALRAAAIEADACASHQQGGTNLH
jgi:hypothetical protein